jgi:glycosyltransferase involved in cell wall biosynthesis
MTYRICLVSGEYPPAQGGVGDYTACLAAEFARQGHEVLVATSRRIPATAGGNVFVYPLVERWTATALPVLRAFLHQVRPDVVHVQYQPAAFGMEWAVCLLPAMLRRMDWHPQARAAGSPLGRPLAGPRPLVAVTCHDLRVPWLFAKAGPLRELPPWLMRRTSDAVIAVAAEDLAMLRARGEAARAVHIPIGSNIAEAPPPGYRREGWRASHGVGPDEQLIGFFGFANASKGLDTWWQALDALHHAGRPVRPVLIGGTAGDSDATNAGQVRALEQWRSSSAAGRRAIVTGFLPPAEVSAWLLACDACALPFRDGASLRRGSLLAALLHGVPVVTTFPPEVETALEPGRHVLCVPPGDAGALAGALARLLDDPELRERLAQASRALAGQYTWSAIATQHLRLYQDLLVRLRSHAPTIPAEECG